MDKKLQSYYDQLVAEEEELADLGIGERLEARIEYDEETERRIKERTLERLGIASTVIPEIRKSPSHRLLRRLPAAAALLLLILGALYVLTPVDVKAQLRKALEFLPGYGVVRETDGSAVTYALPKPVTWQDGEAWITVDAVLIDGKGASVSLTGQNTPDHKQVTLRNSKGKTYKLKRTLQSTSGGWTAGFWADETAIEVTESMELQAGEHRIQLSLKPTGTLESFEELGSTSTANGVSITAVVSKLEDGRRKVNLVPRPPEGWRVDDYGIAPINGDARMVLQNAEGKEVPYKQVTEPFIRSREFEYDSSLDPGNPLTLTLPYIALTQTREEFIKVELELPKEGGASLNRHMELWGFPIDLLRLEKVENNQVRLDVDLQYDPSRERNLLYFMHNPNHGGVTRDEDFGGYSWKQDDHSKVATEIYYPLKQNQQILELHLGEPRILLKGPWTFTLEDPKD